MTRINFLKVVLIGAVFVANSCYLQDSAQTPTTTPTPPTKFSVSDLEKLRWIEGTWRGSGDVEAPFFERYRFENETTLAVDSFTDDTLNKVEDTTRFELKDGQFGNGGEGSRWTASLIDYQGVTFVPLAKAKNSFRWQRESNNIWTAILKWPPAEGKPGRQRVYKMERWPKSEARGTRVKPSVR
jgi:hypothetical protein